MIRLVEIAALASLAQPCVAQTSQPALQITAPSNGTVVAPGQSVSVNVAGSGGTFTQVGIIGEYPIPSSSVLTAAPFHFSITVPATTPIGTYDLTAVGSTAQTAMVESEPVTLYVESAGNPTSISTQPSSIAFESQGQRVPVRVQGTFPDGSVLDLTGSSQLAFSSSNTAVATASAGGVATAIGPGTASISVTYARAAAAGVPVTVAPLSFTASPQSLNFPNTQIGSTAAAQTVTVTNASSISLILSSVLTAGDFNETDTCSGKTLASGGVCTVSVTYTPSISGPEGGELTIVNGLDVVPLTVALSGTGISATAATLIASIVDSGNLTLGESGATYTISVQNISAGPYSGSATVREMLPASLTLAALGGTGWTCTVSLEECNRSDGLAAGGSYPAVTATVSVSGSAPQNVSNPVILTYTSGSSTVNYTAVDSATVLPLLQTIAFGPLNNVAVGSPPFAISATASSGLPVTFNSMTPGACTTAGATVAVAAVGTCSITASQAGNASFPAALPVTQSFSVTPVWQTINFVALQNVTLGAAPLSLSLYATASSGLPVTFASTTTNVCTVAGNTVTILALGPCSITASQTGNASYSAAADTVQSFTVFSVCDLKQTGTVNAGDVQVVINEALGSSAAVNDLNGDGKVNIVDLQLEIGVALGLACTAQ